MAKWQNKQSEILPVALILIWVIIFFSKILIIDASLYGSDFLYYFYPVKKFIRDCLYSGTFPLWNPYMLSGTPFITNIQASMFYPPGLFYYVFSPGTAYVYSTMFHFMLGTIFMYFFMRELFVSRVAGLFSSFIFMFNGYVIGHLYAGHLTFIQTYIWLPLILFFLIRYLNTLKFKNIIFSGLILGLQILGGFPQVAFYSVLAVIAFGFFSLLDLLLSHQYKKVTRVALGLGCIILIGFSISAVQILPTLEFSELSTRAGGVNYEFAVSDSLHPKEFLTFLFPDIFGNVVDGTYWRTPESWHFWEACGYSGIIPLFLIFIQPEEASHRKIRLFFIVIVFVSIFLALGKYNPIYSIIYSLPGFNSFRIPAQIIYLYVFGIAVISGLGLKSIEGSDKTHRRILFTLIFIFTLILLSILVFVNFRIYDFFTVLFKYFSSGDVTGVDILKLYERIKLCFTKTGLIFIAFLLLLLSKKYQKISSNILSSGLLLLLLIDLGIFGIEFIKPYNYSLSSEKQVISGKLNKEPSEGRVIATTPFGPNDGLIYKFPSVLGYDPLILKRYADYIQTSQNLSLNNRLVNLDWLNYPDVKMIGMLNVKKFVNMDNILDLKNDIPYFNFIGKSVYKKEDEILNFIQSDEFHPESMVVFDSKYSSILKQYQVNEDRKGIFSILDYGENEIRISASVNKPGYLVLSEIDYPGWCAKVDGKDVPVFCGNYIFRVIPLSAGEHEIYMYFISWPFIIGGFISLITLFSTITYLLYRKYFKK